MTGDVVTTPTEDGFYTFVISHAVGKGSANLYKAGCRCEECRAANNTQMKAYRERRKERQARKLRDDVAAVIEAGFVDGAPSRTIAGEVIALVKR